MEYRYGYRYRYRYPALRHEIIHNNAICFSTFFSLSLSASFASFSLPLVFFVLRVGVCVRVCVLNNCNYDCAVLHAAYIKINPATAKLLPRLLSYPPLPPYTTGLHLLLLHIHETCHSPCNSNSNSDGDCNLKVATIFFSPHFPVPKIKKKTTDSEPLGEPLSNHFK